MRGVNLRHRGSHLRERCRYAQNECARNKPAPDHSDVTTYQGKGLLKRSCAVLTKNALPDASGNEKVADTEAMMPMIEKANATVSIS
jgi:hypothetical protein